MDTNKLRRLARDVDEQHRTAMRTFADEVRAGHVSGPRFVATRRELLRTGAVVTVAGTAIALGPFVGVAAAATTASAPATAPPVAPNSADLALLGFAQSLELVAVSAYQTAIASGKLADDVKAVLNAFADHHREHAGAFAAVAGIAAPGRPNTTLLAAFQSKFQSAGDQNALLTLALQVEAAASATYLGFLGELTGTRGAGLVASIQPIESAHAVVLGQTLGVDQSTYLPTFETTSAALDPAKYPL